MQSGTETNTTVVLEPAGGPPALLPYVRELWRRREFVRHLVRANVMSEHLDTVIGRAWVIISPLLLAGVYFLLIVILKGESRSSFFSYLVAGLFLFFFTRNSATRGAHSLVRSSRLVLSTFFPRAVLPISAVYWALQELATAVPVFLVIHVALGHSLSLNMLALVPLVAVLTVFNLGLALILATVRVFISDLSNFLPYVLRVWLYVTPVLYLYRDIPERVRPLLMMNPLFPFFSTLQDVLSGGPLSLGYMAWASVEALLMLGLGAYVFLHYEREFGARL